MELRDEESQILHNCYGILWLGNGPIQPGITLESDAMKDYIRKNSDWSSKR